MIAPRNKTRRASVSAFRYLFQLSHTASLNIGEAERNQTVDANRRLSKSDALATAILRFCGLIEGCSRYRRAGLL